MLWRTRLNEVLQGPVLYVTHLSDINAVSVPLLKSVEQQHAFFLFVVILCY